MEPHFKPVSVMVYGRIQDICCAETLRCVLLPYYLAHLNAYYEVYNLTFHFKTAFLKIFINCSVTSSSVQLLSHIRHWDPTNGSIPGFPGHRQFLELAQTHVH